jgi:hypothetical protein
LKSFLLNRLFLNRIIVNFDLQAFWSGIEKVEFSETFNQVTFNNVEKADKGWNLNSDTSFFAWSEHPLYMWAYYINKFHLEICPFIQNTLDKFFFMRPYFKWTQVYFFRLFEFVVSDSILQIGTKLEIIPTCLAKKEKLYSESETWTFHSPLAEEIIERLFGFYDYFDDLCFFFPKSFYNPDKASD